MKREGESDPCGMSWTGYGLRGELDRIWTERRVGPDMDREREIWTEYEKKRRVELQME